MLSEKDKDFIIYWEKEKERRSTFSAKLIDGVARGAQAQAAAISQASEVTSHISIAIEQVTNNAQAVTHDSAEAARLSAVAFALASISAAELPPQATNTVAMTARTANFLIISVYCFG